MRNSSPRVTSPPLRSVRPLTCGLRPASGVEELEPGDVRRRLSSVAEQGRVQGAAEPAHSEEVEAAVADERARVGHGDQDPLHSRRHLRGLLRGAAASRGLGQTLYIVEGIALAQSRGEEILEAHPGDVIWTQRGEEHWHGAAPDHFMTHIALWETDDVDWLEHVTDGEHGGPATAPAPYRPGAPTRPVGNVGIVGVSAGHPRPRASPRPPASTTPSQPRPLQPAGPGTRARMHLGRTSDRLGPRSRRSVAEDSGRPSPPVLSVSQSSSGRSAG